MDPFLMRRIATPANLRKFEYIRRYCDEKGLSPTAVVNGYITSNLLAGIALVSVSDMGQLRDILSVSDDTLDADVIAEIDAIV